MQSKLKIMRNQILKVKGKDLINHPITYFEAPVDNIVLYGTHLIIDSHQKELLVHFSF